MSRKNEPPTAVRRLNLALAKISALSIIFQSEGVTEAQLRHGASEIVNKLKP